jgi:hypothetical protein
MPVKGRTVTEIGLIFKMHPGNRTPLLTTSISSHYFTVKIRPARAAGSRIVEIVAFEAEDARYIWEADGLRALLFPGNPTRKASGD